MNRVIAYVDGNNLHYRTRNVKPLRLLWCNVRKLVEIYLNPDDALQSVRYYTAKPTVRHHKSQDPENSEKRWKRHIKLLEMHNVEIFKGKNAPKVRHIKFYELLSQAVMNGDISTECLEKVLSPTLLKHYLSKDKESFQHRGRVEKKSDVRMATDLVGHAYQNAYDTALIVSADSDSIPAIIHVLDNHPNLKITMRTPPGPPNTEINTLSQTEKYSNRLEVIPIEREYLEEAQFPKRVPLKNGKFLTRPVKYS